MPIHKDITLWRLPKNHLMMMIENRLAPTEDILAKVLEETLIELKMWDRYDLEGYSRGKQRVIVLFPPIPDELWDEWKWEHGWAWEETMHQRYLSTGHI